MWQFLQAAYTKVPKVVDSMAVAPYILYDSTATSGAAVTASMLASVQPGGSTYVHVQEDLVQAAKYGISVVTYEGGPGIAGHQDATVNQQAYADPSLYTATQAELEMWNTLNPGQLFNVFTNFSVCEGNCFGMLTYESELGSHQWDALMSLIYPQGDINQDGVVDANDCAILKAHLGSQGPLWRIQGDLNNDGVVDGADLNILNTALALAKQPLCQ
jgi:hypothetical protein